jgi:hypothetical protein
MGRRALEMSAGVNFFPRMANFSLFMNSSLIAILFDEGKIVLFIRKV